MGADLTATFTLEGDEEMMDKIARLYPAYKTAMWQGMEDWADDVINEAKRITPVDTGALRASGHVVGVNDMGQGEVTLDLGFSAEYAAPVHENRAARHEVGRAKFLEEPLILKSGELLPRIARMMDREAEAQL